jgi:hypothetical protein
MSASLMLRIAAVLTLVYGAGHTAGMPWTPSISSTDMTVLEGMQADRFAFAGITRTYFDFYLGSGVAITLCLAMQAGVLWLLAPLAETPSLHIRLIIVTFFVGSVAHALVVVTYFYWVPLVFAIPIAACLGLAFFCAPRGEAVVKRE